MFLWSSQSHGEDSKLITEDAERRPPQLTGQESFLEEVALSPGKMGPGDTSSQGRVSAPLTVPPEPPGLPRAVQSAGLSSHLSQTYF